MSNQNIFQRRITPNKPKILQEERIFVYVPQASSTSKGIANFIDKDFVVNAGEVSLKWPMDLQIERLSDPLNVISRVKLLQDEFEKTGNTAALTNPITGVKYNSDTAELKLKRTNRNAFNRPDLVMLDSSEFDAITDDTGYVKYKIKQNNPFEKPSLIFINNVDFKKDSSNKVSINWPLAHLNGNDNTNGFGLIKIDANSNYLKYSDSGELQVDSNKLLKSTVIKPTYGGTRDTGFYDIFEYVDNNGYAIINSDGHPVINISKRSIGLNKVENKHFSDYTYSDFGISMKNTFDTKFNAKLDKSVWDNVFSDWNPPSVEKSTAQKWFTELEKEDNSIRQTLRSIRYFLGYFDTEEALNIKYPPNENIYGSYAFVLDVNHYFAIRQIEETYEWFDTGKSEIPFTEFMETSNSAYLPDGVAAAGTSGLWAQSDHVHPTDLTRLAESIYKDTSVTIKSELENSPTDFIFNLWEEVDGQYVNNRLVNIPYVRKAKSLHNYKGQSEFADTLESSELYWAGTQTEYQTDLNTLSNNTLIVVDDISDDSLDNFITDNELVRQGLEIDPYTYDRVITLDIRDINTLTGSILTLEVETSGDINTYKLKPMLTPSNNNNKLVVTKLSNGVIGLDTKTFDSNCIISNINGSLGSTPIHSNSIIATNRTNTSIILPSGKLLLTKSENLVETFDTGVIESKLIVSDGLGSVKVKTFDKQDALLTIGENGELVDSTININNILVTSIESSERILMSGQLLISGTGNRVNTFNTGSEANKLVVSDGLGGIKLSTIPAGKLIYSSSIGTISAFPITESDAGKVFGVNLNGDVSLTTLPAAPDSLPVKTYTSDPGIQLNGTVLCFLNSDPGEYSEGVLYLW